MMEDKDLEIFPKVYDFVQTLKQKHSPDEVTFALTFVAAHIAYSTAPTEEDAHEVLAEAERMGKDYTREIKKGKNND